jgi:hypothetical protein
LSRQRERRAGVIVIVGGAISLLVGIFLFVTTGPSVFTALNVMRVSPDWQLKYAMGVLLGINIPWLFYGIVEMIVSFVALTWRNEPSVHRAGLVLSGITAAGGGGLLLIIAAILSPK